MVSVCNLIHLRLFKICPQGTAMLSLIGVISIFKAKIKSKSKQTNKQKTMLYRGPKSWKQRTKWQYMCMFWVTLALYPTVLRNFGKLGAARVTCWCANVGAYYVPLKKHTWQSFWQKDMMQLTDCFNPHQVVVSNTFWLQLCRVLCIAGTSCNHLCEQDEQSIMRVLSFPLALHAVTNSCSHDHPPWTEWFCSNRVWELFFHDSASEGVVRSLTASGICLYSTMYMWWLLLR